MDSTLCIDPDLLLFAGLFKLADEPDNLPKPLLLLKSVEKRQYEPSHEISNNVVCATSKASDQPGHTRSLIRASTNRLNIL